MDWYKDNPNMWTKEGSATIFLQDMRVIAKLREDTKSSVIVLTKGCKVVYSDCHKIVMISKGQLKLTFKLKRDNQYHMRVEGNGDDNAEGEKMDMKALRRLLETHARMKQRHERVSPGKVKLGWLRINKQSKRIGTTVGKNKKFPEHDKRVKRLAMEDLNAEAGFLNEMLEQSTYIEISELYYNYCAAMGIRPPPREQRYEVKTQQ